jgi:hypothetical protein
MLNAQKMSLLNALASAIYDLLNAGSEVPTYDRPLVRVEDNTPIIAWEGLYDWVGITMGSSLFAGELGDYSKPTEPRVQAVLDLIEERGGFLEPRNSWSIGLYDA